MNYPAIALVDSGILYAYYSAKDRYHPPVRRFFEQFTGKLITTPQCITEVMWLLNASWQTQNEFLSDLAIELYICESLTLQDFTRIAELNTRYADLPADFADLSLVAISERLTIAAILSLDSDFDIYRRYRNQPFERINLPM